MQASARPRWRPTNLPPGMQFLVFAFFAACYGFFFNGGGGNQVARLNQTRAIVERGTLHSEHIGLPTDDNIVIDGKEYSNKAPGTSLLGVPWWALFDGTRRLFGLLSPFWMNFAVHLTTLFTVGLPCAFIWVLLMDILVAWGWRTTSAFTAASATALGTIYFPYATMYFSHALGGALLFGAFWLLWKARELRPQGAATTKAVFVAGMLTGAAVIVEYPAAIGAIVLSVYLLLQGPRRADVSAWIGAGLLMLGLLGVYNALAFGNPLALSYTNYAHASNNPFPQMLKGFVGIQRPRWEIFKALTIGPTRGLLWFSPVSALALPGVFLLLRRRETRLEGLVVLMTIAAFLAFNAGYGTSIRYWGGANAGGPRHLIPMLPFAGLAIGVLIADAPLLSLPLWLPSIGIALALTAVMPQVPMFYSRPLEQFVVPYFLEGRLSVHRGGIVSRRLVTEDSIAYNLGEIIGLSGTWSLLPLALVLIALALAMARSLKKGDKTRTNDSPPVYRLPIGVTLVAMLIIGAPWIHRMYASPPLSGPVEARWFAGRTCEGTPVVENSVRDLEFRFDRGKDIRPWPGTFCAVIRFGLTLPFSDPILLRSSSPHTRLRIAGHEIEPITKDKRSSVFRISSPPSEHDVEIEFIGGVVKNHFEFRYRRPNQTRWKSIPPSWLREPRGKGG